MKFMLIIILINGNGVGNALNSEIFSDLRSCLNAGGKVKNWIENNEVNFGSHVDFECLEVSGTN